MTLETTTISELPNAATPLTGAERIVMDQAGATVDATTQDIANLASAAAGFTYTQTTPAAVHTINHGLGYRPSVELLNAGGQEVSGEVLHPTVNQTIVTVNPPIALSARLL